MESVHINRSLAERNKFMDAAQAGDAEAQYRVGLSYCCTPRNDIDAFYNNEKAVDFLCLSARQGHSDAAFALGKFYSGDTIDGLRLLRRAVTAVRGDKLINGPIAYYWFDQAARQGLQTAAIERDHLDSAGLPIPADPALAPCTLAEVLAITR